METFSVDGEQLHLCPSFPGYSVTESGRLFTHRRRTGAAARHLNIPTVVIDLSYRKELTKPYCDPKQGYLNYPISVNGKQRAIGIHRLIADAFIGPAPPGCLVRHLDDNPKNNHFSNLKYGNQKQNAEDAVRNNKYKRSSNHPQSKLSEDQVRDIRRLRATGTTVPSLMGQFKVSCATIEGIIYNRYYKDVL